ncbi:unannotated protein [freshwater metagenome]|uniref:Unannotated protein n=1 Tax=freshwater metagenome TaxID=449393 RepID=A0A6J6ZJU3_9ZZZZ
MREVVAGTGRDDAEHAFGGGQLLQSQVYQSVAPDDDDARVGFGDHRS